MWLSTPDTIEHILVERQLEPISDDTLDQSTRGSSSPGVKLTPDDLSNMPILQIGKPDSWTLQEFSSPSKLPRSIRAKLSQTDFHVIRLSCAFLIHNKEIRVDWARFRVILLPHSSTGAQPTAFDLYPLQVMQEVKHQTKVTLSPSLTFQEVGVNMSTEFGFEYIEQIPKVSAAIGSSGIDPSWDYRPGKGQIVQGTKWMWLLVKAPKGQITGQALVDLQADVLVRGSLYPVTIRHRQKQAAPQLPVSLWG
jgi:hypothetical protein